MFTLIHFFQHGFINSKALTFVTFNICNDKMITSVLPCLALRSLYMVPNKNVFEKFVKN